MTAKWIEALTGPLDLKKQYRRYQARLDALPEPYGTAAKALDRYFLHAGIVAIDGESVQRMCDDHADLWERAVADSTPIRTIVGDDPVEFAESFAAAYTGRRWMDKERERLTTAIERAAGERA